MITIVAFTLMAATGALVRAEAARRWNQPAFATGTLIVNVTGSFLLGLVSSVTGPTGTIVGVGALGAFTTFSGFARDVSAAVELRRVALAGIYTAVTLVGGVAAALAGTALS